MAWTKTVNQSGFDTYAETVDCTAGATNYTSNMTWACGKTITGTMKNTGTIGTTSGTTIGVQVSIDGTNYGTTAVVSSAFEEVKATRTTGFTIDMSTIYAPYVRLIFNAGNNHAGDLEWNIAVKKGAI